MCARLRALNAPHCLPCHMQDARDAAGCDPAVLIAAKQNALAAKEEEFAAAQADSCARVEEMACIAEDALAAADSYKRMLGSMCQV